MKYLIFLFIVGLSWVKSSLSVAVPHPNHLKKISNIMDVNGLKFVEKFNQYEDREVYGKLPKSLEKIDLQSLNSVVDWENPQSYKIKNDKKLYSALLPSAFLSPLHMGTIFDQSQQLLFSLMVCEGPIFWAIDKKINNLPIIKYKKIATVQGPTLFYHWVIDRLPSILLLKNLILHDPEIKLLICNHAKPYVLEYLELLGIPRDKIILASRSLYYAEEVYFATPFLMEPIPKKLLLALRNELLKGAYEKAPKHNCNRELAIVIQRKEADRRIENIESLIKTIKMVFNEKYEIVIFDANMSIADQIILFNKARLVIGVMASGLTNVFYAKPGTMVIEIHPETGASSQGADWCWWLASALDLDYWVLPTNFSFMNRNIHCPIDKIRKILSKVNEENT